MSSWTLIDEALLFQWSKYGGALLGPCWSIRPWNPIRAFLFCREIAHIPSHVSVNQVVIGVHLVILEGGIGVPSCTFALQEPATPAVLLRPIDFYMSRVNSSARGLVRIRVHVVLYMIHVSRTYPSMRDMLAWTADNSPG